MHSAGQRLILLLVILGSQNVIAEPVWRKGAAIPVVLEGAPCNSVSDKIAVTSGNSIVSCQSGSWQKITGGAMARHAATMNCAHLGQAAILACTPNNGGAGGGGGLPVCGYPVWNGSNGYNIYTGVWWNNTPGGGVWGGWFSTTLSASSYVICG